MTEDDYRCDGKRWTYNLLKEYIDCGTDEELFLAVATLRNDKPDYQQFVGDNIEDEGEKFKQYIPGEP